MSSLTIYSDDNAERALAVHTDGDAIANSYRRPVAHAIADSHGRPTRPGNLFADHHRRRGHSCAIGVAQAAGLRSLLPMNTAIRLISLYTVFVLSVKV